MRLQSLSRLIPGSLSRGSVRALSVALAGSCVMLLGGCDSSLSPQNSFLDQSELAKAKDGLIVPILDHLNEQDKGVGAEFARSTRPTADDLVASSSDYVIGKNDLLNISITDLVGPGIESVRQVRVTESGKISMPLVPQITAAGLTEAQLEQAVVAAYRDANLISNAQVSVTVAEARARTFTVSGAVTSPGEYAIVRSDFRLLDALALAHEVTATVGIDSVYVIRHIDQAAATSGGSPAAPTSVPATNPAGDMLAPHTEGPAAPTHVLSMLTQDATPPTTAVGSMPAPGFMAGQTPAPSASPAPAPSPTPGPTPAPASASDTAAPAPAAAPSTAPGDQEGRYVVIDGKPVLVGGAASPATAPAASSDMATATPTTAPSDATASAQDFEFNAPQEPSDIKIIRIPLGALHRGELKYNIVVRPGDYIYVPQPVTGEYYMGGHILRGGVYSLTARKITLKEAFISAGMLDPVAIPARTQIIRRIDDSHEIFAVVDIEKIFAGTEPDMYLRPDDQVLVGTNIVAPFLAALRNGFRITYGFGFLYDRNYYTGNGNNG